MTWTGCVILKSQLPQFFDHQSEMAGHSKCAKVKDFAGAIDAKDEKIFSKLSRESTVATRLGSGHPDLTIPLTNRAVADTVSHLMESLGHYDDVQQIDSNAEFPPDQA